MKRADLKVIVIDKISEIPPYNDPEDITGSDHFKDDLGKDSLDFVEFVIAIERELKIQCPDEEIRGMENNTIDEMTDYFMSVIEKQKG